MISNWMQYQLGELFDFKNGLNAEKAAYGDGVPFVNVMDVFGNDILTAEIIRGKMQATPKQVEDYSVKRGDVLFNRTSETFDEIAMSAVYLDDQPAVFGGFVIRARPRDRRLNPHFCAYYFQSGSFRKELIRRGQGAVRANIGQKDLAVVPAIVPTLPEQRRIAEILSTWDQAIETTEKLITNSEAQKKALMQELLTGKKRLPGFHGEWNSRTLNELGNTYAGLSGKTKADFGSGKPFVPYKNVFANAELDMSELDYVRLSDGEKQNTVKSGDIIFTTSSETPEEVGMSSAVLTDIGELYLNSFCFGFRIKKQNEFLPSFAKHLFRSLELRRAISSLAQGSTRYNLSKNEFLKISIQLPIKVEQERIVEVLDAVETAHSTEQKKLQKLKVEKSALMQQLLTGKRRVAIKKEEAA